MPKKNDINLIIAEDLRKINALLDTLDIQEVTERLEDNAPLSLYAAAMIMNAAHPDALPRVAYLIEHYNRYIRKENHATTEDHTK